MARKKTWGGKRPGAGRPEKYGEPTITRTFSLPESVSDKLDRLAEATERSASEVAAELLTKGLKRRSKG
jgi:hypothetical protein